MSKRTGATLVEVLVAVFVMGIGLMALLALFPLGVLSMAQAIQDDRAAHSAADATSLAVAMNLHRDPNIVAAFTNPGQDPTNPNVQINLVDPNLPSWPVFVDGLGGTPNRTSSNDFWVGGQQGAYGIGRRVPSYVSNTVSKYKFFTLLDDIRFDVNGAPALLPGTTTYDREINFSWAYLLRRPRNGNTAAVNMDVVVYSRRSLNLGQLLSLPEYAFTSYFDPTTRPNVVTLNWGQGQNPPAVRAGGWILDATPAITGGQNPTASPGHAKFYRVVGINELPDPAPNTHQIEVEVQDNVQDFSAPTLNATFLVLDGVVEVFPRGTQWRP